jgi:hypothetical protein
MTLVGPDIHEALIRAGVIDANVAEPITQPGGRHLWWTPIT